MTRAHGTCDLSGVSIVFNQVGDILEARQAWDTFTSQERISCVNWMLRVKAEDAAWRRAAKKDMENV